MLAEVHSWVNTERHYIYIFTDGTLLKSYIIKMNDFKLFLVKNLPLKTDFIELWLKFIEIISFFRFLQFIESAYNNVLKVLLLLLKIMNFDNSFQNPQC